VTVPELVAPDRLHYQHERIVDLVVDLLRAQLAAEVESDPLGKE